MRDKRGFLLLEVIVAMVMITAVLLYVFRAYATAKNVMERSRLTFSSALLLEERLFYLRSGTEVSEGTTEGEFAGEAGVRWKATAETASAKDLDLYKVTLEVFGLARKSALPDTYSLVAYARNKREAE